MPPGLAFDASTWCCIHAFSDVALSPFVGPAAQLSKNGAHVMACIVGWQDNGRVAVSAANVNPQCEMWPIFDHFVHVPSSLSLRQSFVFDSMVSIILPSVAPRGAVSWMSQVQHSFFMKFK